MVGMAFSDFPFMQVAIVLRWEWRTVWHHHHRPCPSWARVPQPRYRPTQVARKIRIVWFRRETIMLSARVFAIRFVATPACRMVRRGTVFHNMFVLIKLIRWLTEPRENRFATIPSKLYTSSLVCRQEKNEDLIRLDSILKLNTEFWLDAIYS